MVQALVMGRGHEMNHYSMILEDDLGDNILRLV